MQRYTKSACGATKTANSYAYKTKIVGSYW